MPTAFFFRQFIGSKAREVFSTNQQLCTSISIENTLFAGALRYPHYRWWDKLMIQLIMSLTQGETDTSKEVEYTDWNKVNIFCQNFLKIIQN